jgi:hypothetical protein
VIDLTTSKAVPEAEFGKPYAPLYLHGNSGFSLVLTSGIANSSYSS